LKIHRGTLWNRAEYCSGFFGVATDGDIYWFPKPGRLLVKGYFVDQKLRNPYGVMRGQLIGMGAGALDPINRHLGSGLLDRLSGHGEVDFVWHDLAHDQEATCSVESLAMRYGVAASEIQETCRSVRLAAGYSWPVNLSTRDDPVLEAIVDVDCPCGVKPRNTLPGFNDTHGEYLPVSLEETRLRLAPELAPRQVGGNHHRSAPVNLGLIFGQRHVNVDPMEIRDTYCTTHREVTSLHWL